MIRAFVDCDVIIDLLTHREPHLLQVTTMIGWPRKFSTWKINFSLGVVSNMGLHCQFKIYITLTYSLDNEWDDSLYSKIYMYVNIVINQKMIARIFDGLWGLGETLWHYDFFWDGPDLWSEIIQHVIWDVVLKYLRHSVQSVQGSFRKRWLWWDMIIAGHFIEKYEGYKWHNCW